MSTILSTAHTCALRRQAGELRRNIVPAERAWEPEKAPPPSPCCTWSPHRVFTVNQGISLMPSADFHRLDRGATCQKFVARPRRAFSNLQHRRAGRELAASPSPASQRRARPRMHRPQYFSQPGVGSGRNGDKATMPPLPIISGADCIQALRKFGYEFARQNGSHVRMVCPGRMPVPVPMHKPLKRGTLRSILRTAEIEVEVFVTALRR